MAAVDHRLFSSRLFRILPVVTTCAALTFAGCTTTAPSAAEPRVVTLAIVGTNDLHGALAPDIIATKEPAGVASQKYPVGGAAVLAGYIDILREEYGDRLLWLDAGDEFQGSLESNLEQGAPMVRFFNTAGLNAAAVGNHEFDFGSDAASGGDPRGALKARMREAKYPFLAANIVARSTDASPLPAPPSIVVDVAGVKVGIIGLTTVTTAVTTWPPFVADLRFTDLKSATVAEAQRLRQAHADVVLLLAHVGIDCSPADTRPHLWSQRDVQAPCVEGSELVQLLRELPPGTVDAVVSGHSHTIVHNWIAGVPVVQGEWKGHYLNVITLAFDRATNRPIPDRTRIEGPVRICSAQFANQGNCDGDSPAPADGRGALVAAQFHGQTVQRDAAVEKVLASTLERVAAKKAQVIGQAVRPLQRSHHGDSEMGNLITDAIREAAHTDFALVNAGGIRGTFNSGPITFGDVFAAFPFENRVVVLHVTGRQLRLLLRVGESGALGYFPVSGLRVTVRNCDSNCPGDDLDRNGTIEPWEIDRLLNLTTDDGKAIKDAREYTLATNDFIVAGGDFMGWPVAQIPQDHIEWTSLLVRDAAMQWIEREKAVNPPERPLVTADAPRINFVPRTVPEGTR